MPWRPPGADPAEAEALYDGIPAWMEHPFKRWFLSQLVGSTNGRTYWKLNLVQTFDSSTRRGWPLAPGFESSGPEWLYKQLSEEDLLLFADLIVYSNDESGAAGYNERLERILLAGGSARRVGTRDGQAGLERRVPLGVQETAEAVMAGSGVAGQLLSEAWHLAFGQNPDPEKSYSKAVLAVEAAVGPVVLPNDINRRLGKAVGQMREDGDWRPPFEAEHEHAPTPELLIAMIRAFQAGQKGRHVGPNGSTPPSQEAAEAAVVLAVPLVQWFASGAVVRRPAP